MEIKWGRLSRPSVLGLIRLFGRFFSTCGCLSLWNEAYGPSSIKCRRGGPSSERLSCLFSCFQDANHHASRLASIRTFDICVFYWAPTFWPSCLRDACVSSSSSSRGHLEAVLHICDDALQRGVLSKHWKPDTLLCRGACVKIRGACLQKLWNKGWDGVWRTAVYRAGLILETLLSVRLQVLHFTVSHRVHSTFMCSCCCKTREKLLF